MYLRLLSIFAAVALLAACETTPKDSGAGGASGDQSAAQTTAPLGSLTGPAAGTVEDFVVNVGDRVFFGYDRYDLSDNARSVLNAQAAWLAKYPSVVISVEGHCDERGTREYNIALGDRRAASVKDYLTALGVNANRISTVSYGKERPVALGQNETAWSQNRRSVTTISGGG